MSTKSPGTLAARAAAAECLRASRVQHRLIEAGQAKAAAEDGRDVVVPPYAYTADERMLELAASGPITLEMIRQAARIVEAKARLLLLPVVTWTDLRKKSRRRERKDLVACRLACRHEDRARSPERARARLAKAVRP